MSDFATREKNRTYYQEHREQILRATKERRKRNREKYRAYQKEYWSKHYRNYGTKNRVADRAMRERKKPDVEKALSMFKNPQQAAHLAWLLENPMHSNGTYFTSTSTYSPGYSPFSALYLLFGYFFFSGCFKRSFLSCFCMDWYVLV